ncbi:arginine--tRNA ligase [Candidatus Pacearchaeota archaeon]|nr:arginine--tRNA ligase [Candidatus Pacearchaeota archaeon]
MKQVVVNILQKALKDKGVKMKKDEIERIIEMPPSSDMGDYAFPCFFLASKLKSEPSQIALELRSKIKKYPLTDFDDVQTSGAYVNFILDRKDMARRIVWEAITQKKNFGKSKIGKGKRVVVEFSSPNIAKPFGIGHLRSTIIGNSIANLHEFYGFKVTRINYLGDWGTQFGKLLLGYEKFGSEKKLEKIPIKHLLEVYVKANKKIYEKKSREWFKRLEEGDRKALMLWKIFRGFSLEDLRKMYKLLNIKFDFYDGESLQNKEMKKVIAELKEKKLLQKSDGALIVDLKKHNLGVSLIEKSDGTTLYATRDLAAAIKRQKKYKFKKMIYEVGQEQKLHFKQVFKILELMGYKWAKDCVHVDHGLYLDKDGKRFSTRKGKSIVMKDILDKTTLLAKEEIQKRAPKISKRELEKRALTVAIAAIFYGDLKNSRTHNMVFDIKKFVSFEGDTGPYILYSYARASSILRKAGPQGKFKIEDLDPKELELVKKLSQFPDTVLRAYNTLAPSLIANYSFQVAKLFNEFYHACPVIGSENEAFRLALVEAFRQVLRNSLDLLGIETLEEM